MKSTRRLLGHSHLRSLVRSHRSIIRLLRTARFARASLIRSLARAPELMRKIIWSLNRMRRFHIISTHCGGRKFHRLSSLPLHNRCYFSPSFTTGQRYVYSGCSTGRVIIWDVLTGQIVSRLSNHRQCVRDVSWHPYENKIVSTSWDGTLCLWDYARDEEEEEGETKKAEDTQGKKQGTDRSKFKSRLSFGL